MSAAVKIEDAGARRLFDDLAQLRKLKLRVGYQEPEGKLRYSTGITVAKLAAVHEFGAEGSADNIPARSYIRSTIHENQTAIARRYEELAAAMVLGRITPLEVQSHLGSYVVGLIRKKIESAAAWASELDPATVERKGSTTPLDETGLLSRSLSWRVSTGRQEMARGSQ